MTTLTPLALANADVLRALRDETFKTNAALAARVGRDASNLGKSLKALAAGDLIEQPTMPTALTHAGLEQVAALDRADGIAQVAPQSGEIALDLIDEDLDLNPRTVFDDAPLAELTASIGEKGVLQPIMVRPHKTEPGRFTVVMGARRYRAAKAAGLRAIPAVVRQYDDVQALEVATIENLQREDMNPLDEARAFQRIVAARMAADADLTLKTAKELVADAIRKTVRFIELRLQLLDLPPAKQEALHAGDLSVTDARKWLQQRPKLADLTERQWLIALEVLDAQERAPLPKEYAYEPTNAACRAEALDDDDVATLNKMAVLFGPTELWADGYRTGRFAIRVTGAGAEQLSMRFACDVWEEDLRGRALASASGFACHPASARNSSYLTPWLNGPFEPAPEVAATIEADRAERQRQADERAAAEEIAEADRAQVVAAGKQRLALALTLLDAVDNRANLVGTRLADVLSEGGKPLPWTPTIMGGIRAANGEAILTDWTSPPPADVLVRVGVMAVGVNALLGLATPAAPTPPDEAPVTIAEILTPDEAAELLHGDGAAPPTGILQSAAVAATDPDEDLEQPAFLRRLAGATDAAPPAPEA